jgi:hypothetical protein
MALAAIGIGAIAVPQSAMAQTATPSSTTTNPTTPGTTCGTVCPSGIQVVGTSIFGGQVLGGFGALDASGNLTNTGGVTGTVTGSKTGGGDADVTIVYNGPGCSISCGSATVNANINSFERGTMAVTVSGSGAGGMYGIANSGQLVAGAGLSIGYNPGSPTPVHTPN